MIRKIEDFPKTFVVVNEHCDLSRVVKVFTLEDENSPVPDYFQGMRVVQVLDESPVVEGWVFTDMGLLEAP